MSDPEREFLTGILSDTANFRVIVTGTVGPKEVDYLIRKLKIDRDIMAEDEQPARYDGGE